MRIEDVRIERESLNLNIIYALEHLVKASRELLQTAAPRNDALEEFRKCFIACDSFDVSLGEWKAKESSMLRHLRNTLSLPELGIVADETQQDENSTNAS